LDKNHLTMTNQITLIHLDVPMTEPFRISSGEVRSKAAVLIHIECDGLSAFGETSPMSGSFYSEDTPESAWDFLSDYAVPQFIRSRFWQPDFVFQKWMDNAGNRFAWAGLEGAWWDLRAQAEDKAFTQLLGVKPAPIPSGLAVGIYPTIADLLQACSRYLPAGYKRLKIKIQPGWDVEPLRAIRRVYGDFPLMVDANAAYTEKDIPHLQRLDEFGLLMIEQPLEEDDLQGHQRLQSCMAAPICLDESASSPAILLQAIQMQACRIVNIKIQRVGGIERAKAMIELCAASGVPVWMGTMPELGIGALHALYLALHPNCRYPTDVEASSRWYEEDIIDPPLEVNAGWIEIPTAHKKRPNVNLARVDKYTIRTANWKF